MKTSKCKKQYAICMIKHVVHIRSLKQAFNHELILDKVHQVIQFNQEKWLKLYIDVNIKLRNKGKNYFEKDFYKLMNNALFGKTMENVRKLRDTKLVPRGKRRDQLVSEPKYYKKNCFQKN